MGNYDIVVKKEWVEGNTIEYGIKYGNNTILFIKVGQDGNIYGYENKYLTIATSMNKKYGYTVIVSSNPFDGRNPLDNDLSVINEYCYLQKFSDHTIYYMGHSRGAQIALTYGYQHPKIKKMLLINAPLIVNWHKTKAGIEQSQNQEIQIIYGDKDPSAFYTRRLHPLLENNSFIRLEMIENADHHFTEMLDDFIGLAAKYLGEDVAENK